MRNKQTIVAIVPAAGVGSRMQQNAPKQYIQLAGKTILEHTLTCNPKLFTTFNLQTNTNIP